MHIQLSARVMLQAEVLKQLHGLTGPQAARAYAKALNDTGFEVRRAMQDEMRAVFDRPTDYILRSPRVRMAKPGRLGVTIEPGSPEAAGVSPQKVLNSQTWGGLRRDKKFEVILRRIGVLPVGMQVVMPRSPFPGSSDGRGNMSGSFARHLLAYLNAFESGGKGRRRNMTDKRRNEIHTTGGRNAKAGPWLARQYFVVDRGVSGKSRLTGRQIDLLPGIWARVGDSVQPVLLFTKAGDYTPRFDMNKVAQRADAEAYLARRIRFRLREAAGV